MSEKPTNNTNNDEVDILQLLKLLGQGITSIFRAIGTIFHNLFVFFIAVLLFFKRNVLYLLVAVILGFLFNKLLNTYSQTVYEAEAIIEPNFDVELQIQSRIAEYNELISNKDTLTLAQKLRISPKQAATIQSFQIKPVENLNSSRRDYFEYIRDQDSTLRIPRTSFAEYMKDIKFMDYSDFSIKVVSREKTLSRSLGTTIWDFSDSENIKKRQELMTEAYKVNKDYLEKSLNSIDSTRVTQRKVMLSEANRTNTASTSIDFGSKENFVEQPQLYEYEQQLTKEIISIKSYLDVNSAIVNVVKSFPESGTEKSSFIRSYTIPITIAFVMLVLILFQLVKYLNRVESNGTLTYRKI